MSSGSCHIWTVVSTPQLFLFPGPPSVSTIPDARSFDPNELGDSSDDDEEDRFIAPAPPDYHEVVGSVAIAELFVH